MYSFLVADKHSCLCFYVPFSPQGVFALFSNIRSRAVAVIVTVVAAAELIVAVVVMVVLT